MTQPYAPSAALGLYAEMLQAWLEYWPAEQMVVMNYEDLVAQPETLVNGILQKLGAPVHSRSHGVHAQAPALKDEMLPLVMCQDS